MAGYYRRRGDPALTFMHYGNDKQMPGKPIREDLQPLSMCLRRKSSYPGLSRLQFLGDSTSAEKKLYGLKRISSEDSSGTLNVEILLRKPKTVLRGP